MLKKQWIMFLILFNSVLIYPQDQNFKSPYLSVHTGGFLSSIDNFDETYNSQFGFVYGLGLGLPVSTRSYIYFKASLFSKSGAPVTQYFTFENGQPVLLYEIKEGSAEYNQLIINGGFLYNFFLSPDLTLGINGGITYSRVSEEHKDKTGEVVLSIDGSGIFGFFAGAVLEKNFNKSPFSIFFEPQFNFTRGDVLRYVGNYGGLSLNLGVRYYFKERRVE